MGSTIEKETFEKIVKESATIKECLEKMGLPSGPGNYRTFHRYKILYGTDTSHFISGKLHNSNKIGSYIPLKDYLKKDGPSIKGSVLIKKLINEGYKEYKCENPNCGISEWHGDEIVLQLHHIDGNNRNNSVENLMLLCPNCHSQTDNFCRKGKTKKRCKKCGKPIKESQSGYCSKCFKETIRKVERPDKETLIRNLEKENFSSVGRKFGVSDNAVRKWCKYYGIPTSIKFYKNGPIA